MEFVRVATIDEIKPGKAKRFELSDDEPVAIFNVGGTFYAIGDTCTHEEASLSEGDVFGTCVECPLHGAEFDLQTGAALSLPAVLPVPTYTVKVEGTEILISAVPNE